MKIKIILFLFIIFHSFSIKAQNHIENYIEKFDSIAMVIMNNYGIPASVVLGVGLLESGAGTSFLCKNLNNHFGIRGNKKIKVKGKITSYRKFDSDIESFDRFGQIISGKKYYPNLKGDMDPDKWLLAMQKSGYAESKVWHSRVKKIIIRHDLIRFDIPPLTPLEIINGKR